MKKKKRIIIKLGAAACLAALTISVGAVPTAAYNQGEAQSLYLSASGDLAQKNARAAKQELSLYGIGNRSVWAYSALPVYKDGVSLGINARLINGIYYIPVRSFISKTTQYNTSYNSSSRTLTVQGSGLYMSMSDGSYTVYANDRALFEMSPARIMSDGAMYIPAKSLARALGLSVSASGGALRFSGNIKPIQHASAFYDADSVYWLSRIISAESRGEPLIGQIAVGNVIMNRVRSKSFPNTIWGVIFDRKYGVQFSPVANGTIYNTPSYNSVLAAKIVLEGFTVSNDILYFLAPRYVSSSWIISTRPYAFTIKNHEFYG